MFTTVAERAQLAATSENTSENQENIVINLTAVAAQAHNANK